jgi:hypothetical protein
LGVELSFCLCSISPFHIGDQSKVLNKKLDQIELNIKAMRVHLKEMELKLKDNRLQQYDHTTGWLSNYRNKSSG